MICRCVNGWATMERTWVIEHIRGDLECLRFLKGGPKLVSPPVMCFMCLLPPALPTGLALQSSGLTSTMHMYRAGVTNQHRAHHRSHGDLVHPGVKMGKLGHCRPLAVCMTEMHSRRQQILPSQMSSWTASGMRESLRVFLFPTPH
jgi:hypothetical protein